MSTNMGKIRLKTLVELQATTNFNEPIKETIIIEDKTPEKCQKKAGSRNRRRAATTTKKKEKEQVSDDRKERIIVHTVVKRSTRKAQCLEGQLRIDSFFKSATKNYKLDVEPVKASTSPKLRNQSNNKNTKPCRGRKRLFEEASTTSNTTESVETKPVRKRSQPPRQAKGTDIKMNCKEIIDLCSDDELPSQQDANSSSKENKPHQASICSSKKNKQQNEYTVEPSIEMECVPTGRRPRGSPKPCPPYKIIEGTNFCVDGFQFGDIPNVTHYFLTHYHADHYIGLTRKFAHPLYMSPLTARLVRAFIPLDEQYIHEIEVDQMLKVDDIEVTALDANHCPGAVMYHFKLSSGQIILHTGDFRASFEMESLPIFWNHPQMDLLYLDTTYMCKNYDFCHQSESIDRAIWLVDEFHQKHRSKRILHVCGAYVIGKEKIWLSLAEKFNLKVWTEPHRRKAIDCLQWTELQERLCDTPQEADLHVISLGQISYPRLVQYFEPFKDQYDMLLALRPSGWEKNAKPSYGKLISCIGIEYSEHSSYKEMERFVRFLKPKRVISTVPVERDLFKTGQVPASWYKYKGHISMLAKAYQPTITTFMKTPHKMVHNNEAQMLLSPLAESQNEKNDQDIVDDHMTIPSSTDAGDVIIPATPSSIPSKATKCSAATAAHPSRLTSDASDDWLSYL